MNVIDPTSNKKSINIIMEILLNNLPTGESYSGRECASFFELLFLIVDIYFLKSISFILNIYNRI